jgi:hypothetical protein
MEIEIHDLSEDPEFQRRFEAWGRERQRNYAERRQIAERGDTQAEPDLDALWNRQYAKGSGAADSARDHQTVFRCRKVKDARGGKG